MESFKRELRSLDSQSAKQESDRRLDWQPETIVRMYGAVHEIPFRTHSQRPDTSTSVPPLSPSVQMRS